MVIAAQRTPARAQKLSSEATRRRVFKRLRLGATYLILLTLTAILAFPLLWMALTSVKNQREVFSSFLPKTLEFSNFQRVWVTIDLPRHFANSLYVTALTVAMS